MELTDKIVTVIPARGGSKGIPNKNITCLAGTPLIAFSIETGLDCRYSSRTIVDTDSENIRYLALLFGAEAPYLRPEEFARDNSVDFEWAKHFLWWVREYEDYTPKYIIHLRPTTPLRDVKIVEQALTKIVQAPKATSLRSVQRLEESPYKMFQIDEEYLKPYLNWGEGEFYNLPRQHFPHAFYPNGYVDILKSETIDRGSMHGDKMLAFETPRVTELDHPSDLKLLEYEYLSPD